MGKRLLAVLGSAALAGSVIVLTSPAATAATYTPSNATSVAITDNSSVQSNITVNGAGGLITDVNVHINDLSHANPDDLDIAVTGPGDKVVMLMSDTCGSTALTNADFVFDDQAAGSVSDAGPCTGGTFQPTNIGAGDAMPAAITDTSLSAFNGLNPNAAAAGFLNPWRLYLVDDTGTNVGTLNSGWSITIQTGPFSLVFPSNGTDVGPGSPYPMTIPISGRLGKVTDLNVTLPGLTHTFVDDLDLLLVGPNGAKVMLMSDACTNANVVNRTYVIDDEAAAVIPNTTVCAAGTYKPTNLAQPEPVDPMQAPAPAGPYGNSLTAFDGIDPNGNWLLYAMDDLPPGGSGFFIGSPTLNFSLTDVTAPDTLLVGKKPSSSTKTSAKVKFSSSETGSTFQCKLDGGKYKTCTSPTKVKNLKIGKHKLFVRAIDAAGNVDATPLKYKWRVERP
jgi:subtilisin-like proprotein convertase family protein